MICFIEDYSTGQLLWFPRIYSAERFLEDRDHFLYGSITTLTDYLKEQENNG